MTQIEAAKEEILRLYDKSQFEKMLGAVGIITDIFKEVNLTPIVVGGLAVEIYTRSEYTTSDIDLIFSRKDIVEDILLQLGFAPHGRHFYHDGLMISIEIPDDMLEDADYDKVIELELPNGNSVFVIGIEDIILDRLRACVHWKSSSDCEWGRRLMLIHHEDLDIDYMIECSKRDLTYDLFNKWIENL
jgi:hypothetical protein